jgi:hypothetical protein
MAKSKAHTFDRHFEDEYDWLIEGLEDQPCPIPEPNARILAPTIRTFQEDFEKRYPTPVRVEFVRWLTGRLRQAWKDSPSKVVEEQIGLVLGRWWSDHVWIWMEAQPGRRKDTRDSKKRKPRPLTEKTVRVRKRYRAIHAELRRVHPDATERDLDRWATEKTAAALGRKPRDVTKILDRRT